MKTKTLITAILILLIPLGLSQTTENYFIPEPGITPESPLYGLERASESLELAVGSAPVIGSEELEAKIRANHASERMAEAEKMLKKNRTEEAEKLFQEYSQQMNLSENKIGNSTRVRQRLENATQRQTEKLEQIKNKVPEKARKGIEKAIEANKNRMKPGKNTPGKPGGAPAQEKGESPSNPGADKGSGENRGNTESDPGKSRQDEAVSPERSQKPEEDQSEAGSRKAAE